ncbi:FAD binding domain-containing protein [Acidithiobacillus sp. HP-6]|uniref:FAD binding domain-containing protein n=1 Tax=unclassified Acidithiobacillus TaxID=2614800 RepID=UPI001879B5E3|nr:MULTISPECIES: FAD binding domain-containing protein [unclassified Acidithiobacillus]MBE7563871.1 FAD binding domain-containing protein [Acidithiobacillus sp. HP-6]MBE7570648.1 FAD binding domain-containing protein [Acidithiobacillus sp. HP-2]
MAEWLRPRHMNEALQLLAELPAEQYQIISGGTDVMVAQQLSAPRDIAVWLDLSAIPELKTVEVTTEGIRIGAGVTLSVLRRHPEVQKHWPMLAASAAVTGAAPIQNRATLGGNLCNASPAADNAPVLLAYAARIEIAGPNGTRLLPYEQFHLGYRQTDLATHELLQAIHIPYLPAGSRVYYRKVGTRAAQAIAKVGIAAWIHFAENQGIIAARFGLSSVAATPCVLPNVSEYLSGKRISNIHESMIREKVSSDIKPVDDIRSTAGYRLEVASRLVWEAIHCAQ